MCNRALDEFGFGQDDVMRRAPVRFTTACENDELTGQLCISQRRGGPGLDLSILIRALLDWLDSKGVGAHDSVGGGPGPIFPRSLVLSIKKKTILCCERAAIFCPSY